MQCTWALERLSAYLDGMLDEKSLEQIEQHLNDCQSCRKEYDKISSIQLAASSLCEIETPTILRSRIVEALNNEPKPCENAIELISAYLDEELSDAQNSLFTAHITQCESCAQELEHIRELRSLTTQVEQVEPPLALREAISAETIAKTPASVISLVEWLRTAFALKPLRLAGGFVATAAVATVALHLAVPQHDVEKSVRDSVAAKNAPVAVSEEIPPQADERLQVANTDTDIVSMPIAKPSNYDRTYRSKSNSEVAVAKHKINRVTQTQAYKPKVMQDTEQVRAPEQSKPRVVASGNDGKLQKQNAKTPVKTVKTPEVIHEPEKMKEMAAIESVEDLEQKNSNDTEEKFVRIKVASAPDFDKVNTKEWFEKVKAEANLQKPGKSSSSVDLVNVKF